MASTRDSHSRRVIGSYVAVAAGDRLGRIRRRGPAWSGGSELMIDRGRFGSVKSSSEGVAEVPSVDVRAPVLAAPSTTAS